MNSAPIMIKGAMNYVGIGLVLDIAMIIIFMMSDSKGYGIGEPKTQHTILDGEEDEFDFE